MANSTHRVLWRRKVVVVGGFKDGREKKMRGRMWSQSGRGRSQEGTKMSLQSEVFHPPAKSRPRLFLPTEIWREKENNVRERERATARFGLAYPELIQTCVNAFIVFCPKQRGLEKQEKETKPKEWEVRESSEMARRRQTIFWNEQQGSILVFLLAKCFDVFQDFPVSFPPVCQVELRSPSPRESGSRFSLLL